jgi:hypothetical protein
MPAHTSPSPAEIIAALQRGGLVEALKLVVAAKGNNAGGARRSVAAPTGTAPTASRPQTPEPPSVFSQLNGLSPGEVPRSNNDLWLLLLIAAAGIGYYLFGS